MLFRSLALRNIRSYIDERIEFPEGTVLLAGDIGSGKSTILLAAEFALFGIMRGALNGTSLLRHGEREGEVSLTFAMNGKDITVQRKLERRKETVEQSSGALIIDGLQHDLSPVELKSRMLELLGYPPGLLTKSKELIYRYTVYCPQEEMKAILTEAAEMRMDTLRRLFQVEKYRTVRENIQVVKRELKSHIDYLGGEISDVDDLGKRLQEQRQQCADAERESERFSAAMAQDTRAADEARSALASLEIRGKELEALRVEDARVGSLLHATTSHHLQVEGDLQRMSGRLTELSRIPEADPRAEEEYREGSVAHAEAEQRIRSLQEKLARLDGEVRQALAAKEELVRIAREKQQLPPPEDVSGHRAPLERELHALLAAAATHEHARLEAGKLIQRLASLEECPLCLQKVAHEHRESLLSTERSRQEESERQLSQTNSRRSSLSAELAALAAREKVQERARTALAALLANESHYRERAAKLDTLTGERSDTQRALAAAEEARSALPDLDGLKKRLHAAKEAARLAEERGQLCKRREELRMEGERLAKESQELQRKRSLLEADIQRFKNLPEEIGEAKALQERAGRALRETAASAAAAGQRVSSLKQGIAALEGQLAAKELKRKRLGEMRALRDWSEKEFLPMVHAMEQQVMQRVHQDFTEGFQRYLSILLEGEELTVRLDGDFAPVVEQNGYEMPVEDLSGGEKTSLALAYRLAINHVVNDLVTGIETRELIILDEPTDGFSSEQLDRLRVVLDELAVRQALIVSHESKIESFVQHVLRVSKHEHVSRVTA